MKIRKYIALILVAVVLFSTTSPVLAGTIPEADKNAIDMDTVHHVVGEVCTSNSAAPTDSVNLDGNDNIEKTFRFFVSKGLTAQQAAGITGNAIAESGVNPSSVSESGGFSGMFQWDTKGRFANLKKWTQEKTLDPLSLDGQLQFAWYEATERGNIDGIKEQATVDLAAWYWGRFFEVAIINKSTSKTPMTNVQALAKRVSGGNEVFAKYGSSVPSTTTTTSPSSGTGAPSGCPTAGGTGTGAGSFVDGFTVYSQYDPAWAKLPYGSSTIATAGCGPSAMAMIITALTGTAVTPADTASYAASRGMYIPGQGSSWSVAPVLAEHWGLRSEPIGKDLVKITQALAAGGLVVTSGRGAKPFTGGGHYIVIRGITAGGKFLVGDSGHKDTSDKEWDPQPILGSMPGGSTYAIYK